jgi:hypothetical protein
MISHGDILLQPYEIVFSNYSKQSLGRGFEPCKRHIYASPILEYSSEPFPVKHSARPIPHRISDPNSGCVSRHKQYITTSWKDSVQTSCLRFPAGLSSSASTSTPTSRYGDPGRVYEKACAPKTGLQSQVLQRVRRIRPSRVIYPQATRPR